MSDKEIPKEKEKDPVKIETKLSENPLDDNTIDEKAEEVASEVVVKTTETSKKEETPLDDDKASDDEEPSTPKSVDGEDLSINKVSDNEDISATKAPDDADKAIEKKVEVLAQKTETPSAKDTVPSKVSDDEDISSSKTSEDEEEINSSDEDEHDEDDSEEKAQKDYHDLSKKELITELQQLLKNKSIQVIKHDVEEIKTEFNAKFQEELNHKKEEFLAEGGNIIDFHYSTPLKKEFNSLYFDFKEKRNNHFKNLKKDLQANLQKRNELVDELKGLLNAEENINTTYKHFKDIQERWHQAGAIPRDKYNTVWNTYHHHVENFYDFLHLNREFRDLDFKHNLDQKLKLIIRAEELSQGADVDKAFRELQMLHKMWKEEIGPVAKEYREDVWDKFSAYTKIIHDKRHENLKEQEKQFEKNYDLKKELILQIDEVSSNTKTSHQAWQNAIKKVQQIRDAYFELGKVPRSQNKEIWNAFKDSTRTFNQAKNAFYKNQKKEQYTNLEKKKELIKIAEENKESDDFDVVTPLMKKIQKDWRDIGHVPRKDSDKIWKQFKAACNFYFDRLHAQKNEANKEELEHYDTKKELLESLEKFKLSDNAKEDLNSIKAAIKQWKNIGRVPYNKKSIDQKFNKVLDDIFGKLDLGKKETELIKFENKVSSMVSQEDERKLQNEQYFITKKIEESKNEIRQLENNLGFFQHVDDDNPMVKEVHGNIARQKEQLEVWKAKLKKIKTMRQ